MIDWTKDVTVEETETKAYRIQDAVYKAHRVTRNIHIIVNGKKQTVMLGQGISPDQVEKNIKRILQGDTYREDLKKPKNK